MTDPSQANELKQLRVLARANRSFDASGLAKLAKEAGLALTAEQIQSVADDLATELGEDDLERVAGGVTSRYDFEANKKV